MILCSVVGCSKAKTRIKYCAAHYAQILRHGKIVRNIIGGKHSRTKNKYTYTSYYAMLWRCNPKNSDYKYYKKIKICDRWLDKYNGFDNFVDDMGKRPKGLTLDRIDNGGNYEPQNCRWATRKEQSHNSGQVLNQKNKDIKLLCIKHNVKWHTVYEHSRKNNITPKQALLRVVKNKEKKDLKLL